MQQQSSEPPPTCECVQCQAANLSARHCASPHQARQEEDFEEGEEGTAGAAGEEGGDKATGGKFPWSGTDRDYDYEELLGERCRVNKCFGIWERGQGATGCWGRGQGGTGCWVGGLR